MMEHDRIRFDLCCAARLLYRNGLSAANAGHISMAIGGGGSSRAIIALR